VELTELAGHQPVLRELVRSAFHERLGPVEVECTFHRGWNGGWRCRATVAGKRPLDFALLRTPAGALLALPVPMPSGWHRRGVAASDGSRWSTAEDGLPVPIDTTY
jgi:hypothetical protein